MEHLRTTDEGENFEPVVLADKTGCYADQEDARKFVAEVYANSPLWFGLNEFQKYYPEYNFGASSEPANAEAQVQQIDAITDGLASEESTILMSPIAQNCIKIATDAANSLSLEMDCKFRPCNIAICGPVRLLVEGTRDKTHRITVVSSYGLYLPKTDTALVNYYPIVNLHKNDPNRQFLELLQVYLHEYFHGIAGFSDPEARGFHGRCGPNLSGKIPEELFADILKARAIEPLIERLGFEKEDIKYTYGETRAKAFEKIVNNSGVTTAELTKAYTADSSEGIEIIYQKVVETYGERFARALFRQDFNSCFAGLPYFVSLADYPKECRVLDEYLAGDNKSGILTAEQAKLLPKYIAAVLDEMFINAQIRCFGHYIDTEEAYRKAIDEELPTKIPGAMREFLIGAAVRIEFGQVQNPEHGKFIFAYLAGDEEQHQELLRIVDRIGNGE